MATQRVSIPHSFSGAGVRGEGWSSIDEDIDGAVVIEYKGEFTAECVICPWLGQDRDFSFLAVIDAVEHNNSRHPRQPVAHAAAPPSAAFF